MAQNLITVLVASADVDFGSGLARSLTEHDDLRVHGPAESRRQVLSGVRRIKPEVVLLDHSTGGGPSTCRELMEGSPSISVVILSDQLTDDVIYACLRAGARAHLPRSSRGDDLASTIRTVARGQAVFSQDVTGRVLEWVRWGKSLGRNGNLLSPYEVELLVLVARGLTNRAIGEVLHASEHTVKVHLSQAMRKLGAVTRSEAIAIAIRRGIL